jgi:hypothetical protein
VVLLESDIINGENLVDLLAKSLLRYFKYHWKTPGKRKKKVLESPGFLKL